MRRKIAVTIVALLSVSLLSGFGDILLPYGEDITLNDWYIESGHYDIYSGWYAYDQTSTYWRSSLAGAACESVCYVGQDFGEDETVSVIGIVGYGYFSYSAASVDVLYSDNCSDYTLVDRYLLELTAEEQFLKIEESDPHRCWIVRAYDMYSTGQWIVTEVQMFNEPLDQIAITGTLESGEGYQIDRFATFGDIGTGVILMAIAIILSAILFVSVVNGKRNSRNI